MASIHICQGTYLTYQSRLLSRYIAKIASLATHYIAKECFGRKNQVSYILRSQNVLWQYDSNIDYWCYSIINRFIKVSLLLIIYLSLSLFIVFLIIFCFLTNFRNCYSSSFFLFNDFLFFLEKLKYLQAGVFICGRSRYYRLLNLSIPHRYRKYLFV